MNIVALLSLLSTIIGDMPKVLAAVAFLVKAIGDAEATGQTGEQKLAAVLNDFEAFLLAAAPTWAGEFQTIAADVEAAVGDVVALYNDFAHAAPLVAAAVKPAPVVVRQVVAAPAPPVPSPILQAPIGGLSSAAGVIG